MVKNTTDGISLSAFGILLLIVCGCYPVSAKAQFHAKRSFAIDYTNNCFLKDDKPFRYISGSLHYFRIPRIYWSDRLAKAKALGLNAIQTYVAWNVHERNQPGKYDFDGENDLLHFIDLAQENDLLVILRPGPYIDAEWEFGGFPWWLVQEESLVMRSSEDQRYMDFVESWMDILLEKLKPKLYKNGGPVIAIQVENEYGNYYACDHNYLNQLSDIFQKHLGDDVILFTTDGYSDDYLKCGTVPSLYTTIDFGTEISAEDAFKQQRKYQPQGPLVNSEFYTGLLDYWTNRHQTRGSRKVAEYLDRILALNASVNLYMFNGGTNFRFMNGVDKNKNNSFLISITSYDYDAPLSEAGDPTEKYFAIREVLKKYDHQPLKPVPKPTTKTAYGKLRMSKVFLLIPYIYLLYPYGVPFSSTNPLTMEEVNQGYGFLLYATSIPLKFRNKLVTVHCQDIHDRYIVYIDGGRQIIANRGSTSIPVWSGKTLEILVENQGRIAYGPKGSHYLPDKKGILGNVRIENEILLNWSMFPVEDEKIAQTGKLFENAPPSLYKTMLEKHQINDRIHGSVLFTTTMEIHNVTDTYIKMDGWQKGQIYVNSFNIGRYWQTAGPQKTLYVPKSVLQVGRNDITVLELDGAPCFLLEPNECVIEFVDKPILG